MKIQALSALLAAIVTLAIGASVVLRDRRQRVYRLFAVLCLVVCAWHILTFFRTVAGSDWVDFAALFVAIFIPISSVRFFRIFLIDEREQIHTTPRWMIVATAGFLVALGYAIAFRRDQMHHSATFTYALAAYEFLGLYTAMWTLYGRYRRTLSRVEKTRLQYLFVGGIATISLAANDFFSVLPIPIPALGTIFTVVYMYFISQTLFRYRLLDLTELLGKMVVTSSLVLAIAALYGLLVAWIPSDQPGVFFFNTLVASFVILILFEPLRLLVEGQVQKWMFREKYELRARVDELGGQLANVIDIREAVRLTLSNLEESRRVTHGAVYLVDSEGAGYDLVGHFGPRPAERSDAAARRPFFERLAATRGPIAIEQLEREHASRTSEQPDAETGTIDAIALALEEMNASLCIPIVADDQILGLLCLKDERVREAYATDEVDMFRGLATQFAITLQNSRLYDRMKERDRLAALGEMAAGLAHEIRNPLGAIKGAAQLLQPHASDVDEFLGVIVEEANRLNRVVSQFLDYARPYRGEPAALDVNEVIKKTTQLVQPQKSEDGTEPPPVEITLSLDESLPRVRADAEQLRQVFLNLAINAVQAMPSGGKLNVSTALRRSSRRGAQAQSIEVRFRDTGQGITASDLKNLFIPFFTTKEKGTGLGLPISQRIIESHGGTIEVRSRPGTGSTFTVVLPAMEEDVKVATS